MAESSLDLENVPWPVLVVDAAGVLCQANAAAQRVFASRLEGKTAALSELCAPESGSAPAQWLAQAKKGAAAVGPLKVQGWPSGGGTCAAIIGPLEQGGQTRFLVQFVPGAVPETLAPGAGEGTVTQKQKLECALQLTRSVALDFNNTLTTILGQTSYLLGQAEADHPWRKSLLEVEKAAVREAEIASQLAAFSSEEKDPRWRAAGSLNKLVRHVMSLFQTPQHSGLNWVLHLESKLFGARYDEAKLQQAILKVLENAVEAVKLDGRIIVRTRNLELTEPLQDRTVQLRPGAYVCLEISDDGGGIEAVVLPRVFDPFFTTKTGHRGLGLAWVYGIVTNHGGGVAISSEAGRGTSVRLYLPATRKIVQDRQAAASAPSSAATTVLVVDDEEMILTMSQMVLGSQGFRVTTAPSGEKALEIVGRTSSLFDLLITDMVMPGMNGRELIERIRVLSPKTRILCVSGCAPSQLASFDLNILPKPFTAQQLLRKVKELLAGS